MLRRRKIFLIGRKEEKKGREERNEKIHYKYTINKASLAQARNK